MNQLILVGLFLCGSVFSWAKPEPQVLAGVDVFFQEHLYEPYKGKRIGLITNQTGVDGKMRSTVQLFLEHAPVLELTALFSPEHGLQGQQWAEETSMDLSKLHLHWRPRKRG